MNILVLLPVNDRHRAILESSAPGEDFIYTSSDAITREQVANANVILGNIDPALLTACEHLQLLQLQTAGYDDYLAAGTVPAEAKLSCSIGAYGQAVSEHMFAMVLSMMKRLPGYHDLQREHRWEDLGPVTSLKNANVLVLGAGDIGGHFATLCRSMGAHVRGIKRHPLVYPIVFEDMDGMGERYARDAVTGERFKVPGNMTYDQWKAQQDALHGQGTVDKMQKISYNETTDRAQFEKYRERLGADAPRYFKDFQALKYDRAAEYKDLAGLYSYKGRVPEASKADYKAYEAVKATGVPGSVRVPAKPIEVDELVFKDAHGTHHGCTLEDAKGYIRQAKCSITRKRWDGYHTNYYSFEGAAYMDDESGKINTAFFKSDFDPKTKEIMEVFE